MKQNTKNLITWGRHPSHGGAWMKLHEFSKAKNAARLKEGWTLEFHPKGEKPDAPVIVEAMNRSLRQAWTACSYGTGAKLFPVFTDVADTMPATLAARTHVCDATSPDFARLIAAAPDLLAALEKCRVNLYAALIAMKETEATAPKAYAAYSAALAAIDKAKGTK